MNRKLMLTGMLALGLGLGAGYGVGRLQGVSGSEKLGLNADRSTPVLATFEGGAITAEEFLEQVKTRGTLAKQLLSTPKSRMDLIRQMARSRILALSALSKGYQQDEEVQRRYLEELAARFIEHEFELPQRKQEIPEAELKSWYDSHPDQHARPERIRLAVIFLAAPEEAKGREAKRRDAQKLLSEVKKQSEKDVHAFAALARAKSEDSSTRPYGGELPLLPREQLEKRVPPSVVEAGFSLSQPGQILNQVVEAPQGFYVLRLTDREAAQETPFERMKDAIAGTLRSQRRQKAFEAFLAQVESSAHLSVDEKALAALSL